MGRIRQYLEKQALRPSFIKQPPSHGLNIIVCVPAYDEPDLWTVLQSLGAAARPSCRVEVLVHVNTSETASEEIKARSLQQYENLRANRESHWFDLHPLINIDLPPKRAGAGLARKIVMDEACRRFDSIENPNGIIVCLDADCEVSENYFVELERWSVRNGKIDAASIYYEHDVSGASIPAGQLTGIIDYELHLRYYIQAVQFAGHPHAFQTVGSAMAVRAGAYVAQGGMNQRQAGEDFYFLQKFAETGKLGRLNRAVVFPSSRKSHRVPFGTGRAMNQILGGEKWNTYPLQDILSLTPLLAGLGKIHVEGLQALLPSLDTRLQAFLAQLKAEKAVSEIKKHTGNLENFRKRFYRWFNMFTVMKYLNQCREQGEKVHPAEEYAALLCLRGAEVVPNSPVELLALARKHDLGLPENP